MRVIVDDSLSSAGELREVALSRTCPPQDGAFPGRNSLERIGIGGLAQKVSDLVREPLKAISPRTLTPRCTSAAARIDRPSFA